MTKIAIIGAGWRAEYYLRIARELPELFQVVGMVVRNPERRTAIGKRWACAVFASYEELRGVMEFDFVVVAVSKASVSEVVATVVESGKPILLETPPAQNIDEILNILSLCGDKYPLQVAEQYPFQPMHMARKNLIDRGLLGEVSSIYLSVCHGYHAISLIRAYMKTRPEMVKIRAEKKESRLNNKRVSHGLSDGTDKVLQTIAVLDLDGKSVIYDFTDWQYYSWIRQPNIIIRGNNGEISNTWINYCDAENNERMSEIKRRTSGEKGDLNNLSLHSLYTGGGETLYENPFRNARLSDEEIAVAACLLKMTEYIETGNKFYDLEDACYDTYLSILIEQAALTGEAIVLKDVPWE
ncbi:MAG: Gfo/Idh/MocA family protein [Ignavibacteriales bacterium]